MHPVRNDIIYLLMHAPVLTYTQLKPDDVPSNRFAYHIEQLAKDGLIAKTGEGYILTAAGMSLADRVSHETMAVRMQPHIVTTLRVTNRAGQTALFRHAFQPYFGIVGYPQGRIHYGESVAQAAARELQEKTGLSGVALKHRGIVYVTGRYEAEDISRILCHVFSGEVQGTPELSCTDTTKGSSFWGSPYDYTATAHMPGFNEITALLAREENNLFFDEITAAMPPTQRTQ